MNSPALQIDFIRADGYEETVLKMLKWYSVKVVQQADYSGMEIPPLSLRIKVSQRS